MYGYIAPPSRTLTLEDFALFDAFYCGLCHRVGKLMGQAARFTVGYDMTFLSVLIHDLKSEDVQLKPEACILNPRKRAVAHSELMDVIASVNVIMSYYKVKDGVADREGLKYKIVKTLLAKAYKVSRIITPWADEMAKDMYEKLNELERQSATGIDRVAHIFASMIESIGKKLLGNKINENSSRLFYNIGKFVYMADALDDIDEDFKKGRYNPFLTTYPYNNKNDFLRDNQSTLRFMFASVVNRSIECFNNLSYTQSYDLLRKFVHIGLRQTVDKLLGDYTNKECLEEVK